MNKQNPQVPRVDADPECRAATDKLNELMVEHAALVAKAERVREARARRAMGTETDRLVAEYLGDYSDQPPEGWLSSDELADVERRVRAVRRATETQRAHVERLRATYSARVCTEIRPRAAGLMQDLAEKAVALGEAADALHRFQRELDAAGLRWEGHLPAVALRWMRSAEEGSRLNMLVDEIERDYGLKVKRPHLEAARRRALQEHMETEERKRLAAEEAERDKRAAIERTFKRGRNRQAALEREALAEASQPREGVR